MYIFLRDLAYLIAGGLALMMVIMLGEIDISSGTVLGLIGFVTGTTLKMGIPIPAVLLIAVCVGMLNSAIIAFVTVRFRVPSMIVSLAMVKLHVGVFPLLPDAGWVSNIPSSISDVGGARLFGVFPVILLFALVLLIFFCWFMKYTRFGRKVYAVGGNKESAKLAGINADKVTFLTFLTSGALLGVTAMMYWLPKNAGDSKRNDWYGNVLPSNSSRRRCQHHGRNRKTHRHPGSRYSDCHAAKSMSAVWPWESVCIFKLWSDRTDCSVCNGFGYQDF